MPSYTKIGGVWKINTPIHTKEDSLIKEVSLGYVKDGNIWKRIYTKMLPCNCDIRIAAICDCDSRDACDCVSRGAFGCSCDVRGLCDCELRTVASLYL